MAQMTESSTVARLRGVQALKASSVGLSIFSGLLLVFSFPKFSAGRLAWLALVPFFFAIRRCVSARQAILCSGFLGLVFFGFSIHWLTYVHTLAWLFAALIETFFMALFAWAVYAGRDIALLPVRILWMALAWMAMEFLRSEMPVFGFGWNLLAYSQADFPRILQSANTVGAYGLSFLIALVNTVLYFFLENLGQSFVNWSDPPSKQPQRQQGKPFQKALLLALFAFCIFMALIGHGNFHLREKNPAQAGTLRISLLQGNIPQDIKWEAVAREKILAIYTKLTELAAYDQPDLIFWPESAFPGYFNRDVEANAVRALVAQIGISTVIGAPHYESPETAFNSTYLLGPDGEIKKRYDKLFLVPFGEYVPLKPLFGWLEPVAYSLGVSDFSSGREFTVFEALNGELFFSTLICFENIFPDVSRKFVERGAQLMAVMTNDAWFGPTSAPYQHLQASIFRAVENGVPVVHVANTGVSAFISRKGKVLDRVQDVSGKDIFVTGRKTITLSAETEKTLYRRGGYLFPRISLAVFFIMILIRILRAKQILRFAFLVLLSSSAAGCIRVAGTTGYTHQGKEDEYPETKQVGFDTDKMIHPNKAPGSITYGDEN